MAATLIATLGAVPRAQQLPIKIYTAADGLTYEVTRRIVADSHGFLWFCTQGALSRFDGYAFRNYGRADGLSSPSINDLLVTRAGAYWVATNGGGVTVFTGYRYRVRRLLALERVRTHIASDLHDDLGSTLSQIAILSEVAARRLGTERPIVAAPLGRIAELSRESLDAMGDIVWAIDPRKDRVANLTQRMRRFAEDLVATRGIDLQFDTAADADHDLAIAADVRREVFLVFKEAMKNAARHSGCQRVVVVLRTVRGMVTLSVSDDGRGFDSTIAGDGHGLNSLRRRAAALHGTLVVESALGAGTRVALSVPATPRRT